MDILDDAESGHRESKVNSHTFISLHAGRDWLTKNGWQPRHGGGYEKAGGFAVMRSSEPSGVVIEIH